MMSNGQKFTRFAFYSVWAVLMTVMTYVLGGVPLKVLRAQIGRVTYWTWMTAVSVGFYAAGVKTVGIMLFSLVILIGVFSELEELHLSFPVSAFFTLLINTLITGGAFALWVSRIGPKWFSEVNRAVETAIKQLSTVNPAIPPNYAELVVQVIPSAVLVLWISALYLAVLLEKRLSPVARPEAEPAVRVQTADTERVLSMREQLAELRMPDAVVWIFIIALLAAFGGMVKKPVEIAAINVLNVCALLFFLQGIAVVARFFERLKMGSFWQFVFMVLIVIHLFLFVSFLGLMDYWLDMRSRMSKRPQEYNRET